MNIFIKVSKYLLVIQETVVSYRGTVRRHKVANVMVVRSVHDREKDYS